MAHNLANFGETSPARRGAARRRTVQGALIGSSCEGESVLHMRKPKRRRVNIESMKKVSIIRELMKKGDYASLGKSKFSQVHSSTAIFYKSFLGEILLNIIYSSSSKFKAFASLGELSDL